MDTKRVLKTSAAWVAAVAAALGVVYGALQQCSMIDWPNTVGGAEAAKKDAGGPDAGHR